MSTFILDNREKIMRIRIEPGEIEVSQKVEEFMIGFIRSTLEMYKDEQSRNEQVILRRSTVTIDDYDGQLNFLIHITTQRQERKLKAITFLIEKLIDKS